MPNSRKNEIFSGWDDVDKKSNAKRHVRYLDGVRRLSPIQSYKKQTFDLLNIKPGHHILEVGCGTGEDVQAIARLAGREGRVAGVDNSKTMIEQARERAKGLSLPVEYHLGDAYRLDFADNTFDGCRADRILQYLEDPGKALTELYRVARSGARIVISEPDWETLIIDSPDKELTRRILNFRCDKLQSGWIGRQLPRLLKEVGLDKIKIIPVTGFFDDYTMADKMLRLGDSVETAQEAGVISADEATCWLSNLEKAGKDGRFFSSATLFIICGEKG